MRVFAGEVIRTHLAAGGETILNPQVFADFTVKDGFGILEAVPTQIFALSYDPDADHVIVLRNVPEPALTRNHGHGGLAFVDSFVALGSLVVGPDCDFIEIGIGQAPALAHGGETFLAAAVECNGGAEFEGGSIRSPPTHASDPAALVAEAGDGH